MMDDRADNYRDNKSKIPTEAELEAMLEEDSEDAFGQTEFSVASADQRAVLKEWTAQDFANIYTRFRPHLERHARRFLRNSSQVDEVVQDAFLYLMVTLPELDSELGVLRFMKWKVRLLCLDVIRSGSRAYMADIEEHQDSLASDDEEMSLDLERAEEAAIVRMALAKLQPRHREILIASIYEEKSTLEIADQVGLSENATRQLMHRARAALKKALIGEADTAGLSLSQILSVAARKAAHDAKNAGVQAMSILAIAVLGVAAFLNFGSFAPATQVAEAPEVQTALPQAPTESQAQIPAPDQSSATNEPEQTAVVPAEEQPVAAEPEPAAEPVAEAVTQTVAVIEPEPASPQPASSDSTSATSAAVLLTDPSIDRSPFDPWLVDPFFEQRGTADLLLSSTSSQDIFARSQYAAISEAGIWADFSFKADGTLPISDVRVGFVADQNQYFAVTRKVDYLVGRLANGLDRYTYIGEIKDIRDINNNVYSNTRMDGVRITLEVLVDPIAGKVVSSSIFAQSSS
jgi:RNA polymerase sigma factor (sigma-70 family)